MSSLLTWLGAACLALRFFAAEPAWARPITTEEERFLEAIRASDAGDYAASLAILTSLVSEHPQKALYWFNLGNTYYRGGRPKPAASCYRRVIGLGSPLVPVARLYLAKALREAGEERSAAETLLALREEALPRGIAAEIRDEKSELGSTLFRSGMSLYQEESYPKAERKFAAAFQLSGDDESLAMRGLTLLRMNDPARAREAFTQLLARTQVETRREEALYFLNQIRDGKWRQRDYWVLFDVAPGYNTNIFAGGQTETITANAIADFSLSPSVKLLDRSGLTIISTAGLFWEEAIGLLAGRLVTESWTTEAQYTTSPWTFRAAPILSYEYIGGDSALFQAGGSVGVGRNFGPHFLGLGFSAFHDAAGGSNFDFLSGTSLSAELRGAYETGPWSLYALYDLSEDAIGDLPVAGGVIPLANWSHGPGLGADCWLNLSLKSSLFLSYSFRNFANPSQPDGTVRRDRQLAASLRVSQNLSARLLVYLSLNYVLNQSTMGSNSVSDRNFDQWIARTGLTWDLPL